MNERRANFLLGEINRSLDAKTREETAAREQRDIEGRAHEQRLRNQKNASELSIVEKRSLGALATEKTANREKNIAMRLAEQNRLLNAGARPERKNDELVRQNQDRVRQQYLQRQRINQRDARTYG